MLGMMKFTLLLLSSTSLALAASYPTTDSIEGIPEPPLGKRWVLNEQFSDEFNGSRLDGSKWLDYHPNWQGREPGLFEAKNVSLKDGYLILKGEKMKKPQIVKGWNGKETSYDISCAAVVSKTQEAHYGYYECRFKANKTTLSATFWLSSRGKNFPTEGKQPAEAGEGTFHQELDICECIGRTGDFSGKNFYKGMNANVHYWFTPTGGEKQDIRANGVTIHREDGKVPSDDFNTYGCWWHDDSSATFYLNNGQETKREFISKDGKIPFKFTEPMGVNLVMETYMTPWIELPNDKELADPKKNLNYYDWVRSYVLVDVDAPSTGRVDKAIFEPQMRFTEKPKEISLTPNPKKVGFYQLSFQAAYCDSADFTPTLMLKDKENKTVASISVKAASGYTHNTHMVEAKLKPNESYTALIYMMNKEGKKSTIIGDSFKFKAVK